MNTDLEQYSKNTLFNNLAAIIVAKDIPAETIASQIKTGKENNILVLWILGSGILIFFILFWRSKKKKKNKK